MMIHTKNKGRAHGFSLIELMVVVAIIAILAGIAIPAFFAWRPNYQLRRAAKDLYSNFQLAKMEAIKTSSNIIIEFNQPAANQYRFTLSGTTHTVNLANYGNGIQYGMGGAAAAVTGDPGPGGTPVSFNGGQTIFSSRGLVNNLGYVYITNGTACFAVGVSSVAGVVAMRRNSGAAGGLTWN